jgi:hypothetical protein
MKKIILLIFLSFAFNRSFAQNHKAFADVDQNELVKSTQLTFSGQDDVKIIWWIPTEFWKVVYAKQPDLSQDAVAEIVDGLDQYTFIGIVDGKMEETGKVKYRSEEFVRKNLQIEDSLSETFAPLDEKNIDETTKMVLDLIKPMLKNMLGAMGDHFYFIAFTNKNSKDKPLLDPYCDNGSMILYEEEEINLNGPIACLLADKICPVDKEPMNGTWKYCPHHGVALK